MLRQQPEATQQVSGQKPLLKVRTSTSEKQAQLSVPTKNQYALRSGSQGPANGLSTTAGTKMSESVVPQFVANLQQRSLSKQFEQMELKQELHELKNESSVTGFVVNALTTANQRASSKSSTGSSVGSFIQKKLTCAVKAGMDIAHPHSSANLAINPQSSTGTNFSSGVNGSSQGLASASSGMISNALKKNNYLNQLSSELGSLYIAPSQSAGSKVPNQALALNPSVG